MKKLYWIIAGSITMLGLIWFLSNKGKKSNSEILPDPQLIARDSIGTMLPEELLVRNRELLKQENIVVLLVDQDCSFCKTAMVRLVRDAEHLRSACFLLINVQQYEIQWPQYVLTANLCLDTLQDRKGKWTKYFGFAQTPSYYIYRRGKLTASLTGLQSTRTIINRMKDEEEEKSAADQAGGQE
ncbi:MAG TPA: hypothetical protein VIK80_09100 [Flavihumibacter sp.]